MTHGGNHYSIHILKQAYDYEKIYQARIEKRESENG
jgi:hypothetical protein